MADDQAPPLPYGMTSLPSDAALALLPPLLSSVSDLNEGLVGQTLLIIAMSRHLEKPTSSADVAAALEAALAELIGPDLIVAHGPAARRPGLNVAHPNGSILICPHADPKAVRLIQEHEQRLAARDLPTAFGNVAAAAIKAWWLDVSFLPASPTRDVIEHDARELAATIAFSLHTASLVLAGAIAEGLLLEALALDAPRAEASKKRTSGKKPLEEWMLNELILVAEDLGTIGRSTAAAAHLELREFRNLIHPRVQIREHLKPTAFAVESSRRMLEQMVAELRPLFP